MAGIFDRGPSAILGELLGGAFGVNQAQSQPGSIEEFMRVNGIAPTAQGFATAQRAMTPGASPRDPAQGPPLPQRNPDRLPNPEDVTRFMQQNNIPMTDGGITEAINALSRQQGLSPSPQRVEESIFGPAVTPAQRAAGGNPGFTDPASIGFNPQLTPAQQAEDLRIQQEVEDDNRDPQAFDNIPLGPQPFGQGPVLTPQDQGPQTATDPNVVGQGQGFSRVPVDAIVNFAQQNGIPLTDGGIHEAARAVMGDGYDFDLIEAGIRGGANPQEPQSFP